ncbi:MAG: hypothetical protein KKH67_11575 [candidate division Zixibacteria bacterium]|nr:hypothetical protein [candidate division Zixibacteria bacterium]
MGGNPIAVRNHSVSHHYPRSPKRNSLEIALLEITIARLNPLIDPLTDLLVRERIREMEHVHSQDETIVRNKKEQLKASMAEDRLQCRP